MYADVLCLCACATCRARVQQALVPMKAEIETQLAQVSWTPFYTARLLTLYSCSFSFSLYRARTGELETYLAFLDRSTSHFIQLSFSFIEPSLFLSHRCWKGALLSLYTPILGLCTPILFDRIYPSVSSYPLPLSPLPFPPFKIRGELKALGTQADIKGPGDRQKLLVRLTQEYVRHLNDVIRGEYRDRLVVTHAELRLYTRWAPVWSESEGNLKNFERQGSLKN